MKERIKAVRKALGLTQQKFAEQAGMSRDAYAKYETGENKPSIATVSLICRTFNVDEVWLRTGVGEMFRPRSREEEIAAYVGNLLSGRVDNEFQKDLVYALTRMPVEAWAGLERLYRTMLEQELAKQKDPAEGQGQE